MQARSKRSFVIAAAVAVTLLLAALLTGAQMVAVTPASPLPSGGPTAPPTPAPSLTEMAASMLRSTVTVEVITATQEQFGTGWLWDDHGDVVTNNHVVAGAVSIRLRGRNGRSYPAVVIGHDPHHDVALLRATPVPSAPPLVLAPAPARPGQAVVAIASSRATGHDDVTTETVQAVGVSVTADAGSGAGSGSAYADMIRLQGAEVFPGNSGGPLLNEAGQVVGIVTLASQNQPVAYAIPMASVLPDLRNWAG